MTQPLEGAPGEPDIAGKIMSTNNDLQRSVDGLGSTLSGFLRRFTTLLSDAGASVGRNAPNTSSTGSRQTAPSSPTTGGSYAAMAPSGAPMRTMGMFANALGLRMAGGTAGGASQGGAGGGAQGPSNEGIAAGLAVSGMFNGVNAYARRATPTVLTMDRAGFGAVLNSGIGPGGYAATAGRGVSGIYGTSNTNLNVTAASPADAMSAAGILNYYSGQTQMNPDGSTNQKWFTAQSGMYAMGYANPYMSQTQVAAATASIASPRSNLALLSLGYTPSLGTGAGAGQPVDPRIIAQNVLARTFRGQSSVSAKTMAAALGQGGSLNANLQYLSQQAGWAPGTTAMLSTYLQQYNNAIGQGATPGQISSLMDQADRGDKDAQKKLRGYGIGATTVQGLKDLQATQTGRAADQYGDFNSSLQNSVSLLNSFNGALSSFLNDTGLGSGLANVGGFASSFPGLTGGAGSFAGGYTTGRLGGGGGVLGGVTGLGMNLATTAAQGAVFNSGGRMMGAMASRAMSSRAGQGARALLQRAGLTNAGGVTSEADLMAASGLGERSALGRLGIAGLGLGIGVAGSQLSQSAAGSAGAPNSAGYEMTRTLGDTASYAMGGAVIGSMFGPEGTLIGGGVGALVGMGQGLWDQYQDRQRAFNARVNPHPNLSGSLSMGDTTQAFSGGMAPAVGLGGGSSLTTAVGGGPSGVKPALGAGAAAPGAAATAVRTAVAQVGKDYVWGATGPDNFDCSGLTQYSWRSAGVSLPRTSQEQMTVGSPVKPGDEQPGDLMLPEPGHITMCIGGGKLVEAPHSGAKVRIRAYSPTEFPTIRRVVGGAGSQNTAAAGGNGATGASVSTATLVGPNGSISELDALTAALTGAFAAPVATATNGSNAVPVSGASGPTATPGAVTDQWGHTYQVPKGAKPAGDVASWISTALTLMGMPQSFAADERIIAMGESAGNPWAINLTDSNARTGHPSEGLMQLVPETFKAHALPGHGDIWSPVDNIVAATRYAVERYKSLDRVPGVAAVKGGRPYVGYRAGAWDVPGDQVAQLHDREMVLQAPVADTIRNALLKDAFYSPGASAAQGGHAGGGVALNFAAGAIQVSLANATAQAATSAARAIVSSMMEDPRVKAMAVGL